MLNKNAVTQTRIAQKLLAA